MNFFTIEEGDKNVVLKVRRACGHYSVFEYRNEVAARQDALGFAKTRCFDCRVPTLMQQWQQKEAIRNLLG